MVIVEQYREEINTYIKGEYQYIQDRVDSIKDDEFKDRMLAYWAGRKDSLELFVKQFELAENWTCSEEET